MALEKQSKKTAQPKQDDSPKKQENTGKRKREGGGKSSSGDKDKAKRWCSYCENGTHNTEQCWFKDKDKNSGKKSDGKKAGKKEQSFSVEQVHALLRNLPNLRKDKGASKKRRVRYEESDDSSTDSEHNHALFNHSREDDSSRA
jgi:hypothetical protein